MDEDTKKAFQMIDVNVYQENLFHTKMMLKEADLNNYLFGMGTDSMTPEEQKLISKKVFREIKEIFYGRNLPEVK